MNIVKKSLEALQEIRVEDLDESISWLEETLHTLKTLRAVRAVLDKKTPLLIQEWESAVDLDKREPHRLRAKCGLIKPELISILTEHPQGLEVYEIVPLSKFSRDQISACLTNHRDRAFVLINSRWYLKVKDPEVRLVS